MNIINKIRFLAVVLAATALSAHAVESPWIVGHRGGRAEYDDNALGAFVQSMEYGVTSFETDVRATKDGELVIMHDGDVARTTNGKGNVCEMTLAEFKSLKLKASGETPPSLADLVDLFGTRKPLRVEFEMKSCAPLAAEAYCDKLYKATTEKMAKGACLYTSFDENLLRAMRKVHPDAKTVYIVGSVLDDAVIEKALALGAYGVAPLFKQGGGKDKDGKAIPETCTTKEMVDKAHAKGLKVSVWMVQGAAAYMQARAIGADTCTSDQPVTVLGASRIMDAKAADPSFNTALLPVTRLQSDSYNWFARHRKILAEARGIDPEVVFVGDSITHFWAGQTTIGSSDDPDTLKRWKDTFGAYRTLDIGYGWDRTANVIWRLQHGEMDGLDPKVVVVHIGGNNLSGTENWKGNTVDEVVEGIVKVVELVHEKAPKAQLLVMGVFPFGRKPTDWHRPKIVKLNPVLEERMKKYPYVKYLNVNAGFLDENGVYRKEFTNDSVHPTTEGYKVWSAALLPEFKRIIGH